MEIAIGGEEKKGEAWEDADAWLGCRGHPQPQSSQCPSSSHTRHSVEKRKRVYVCVREREEFWSSLLPHPSSLNHWSQRGGNPATPPRSSRGFAGI